MRYDKNGPSFSNSVWSLPSYSTPPLQPKFFKLQSTKCCSEKAIRALYFLLYIASTVPIVAKAWRRQMVITGISIFSLIKNVFTPATSTISLISHRWQYIRCSPVQVRWRADSLSFGWKPAFVLHLWFVIDDTSVGFQEFFSRLNQLYTRN